MVGEKHIIAVFHEFARLIRLAIDIDIQPHAEPLLEFVSEVRVVEVSSDALLIEFSVGDNHGFVAVFDDAIYSSFDIGEVHVGDGVEQLMHFHLVV